MFEKNYVVVAETEEKIYQLMRIASNDGLRGEYKIGVYGCERQHELHLYGKPRNFRDFRKKLESLREKENEAVSEG